MTDSISRALKIIDTWPDWKKNVSLTKYSPQLEENASNSDTPKKSTKDAKKKSKSV